MIEAVVNIKIAATLVLVLGTVFWYQNYQLQKMEETVKILASNNAKLDLAHNVQKETIGSLEAGISNNIALNNKMAKDLILANTQYNAVIVKLNSYRGRLSNAAIKKPSLVEHRATTAINSLMRQFATETGSSYNPVKN